MTAMLVVLAFSEDTFKGYKILGDYNKIFQVDCFQHTENSRKLYLL